MPLTDQDRYTEVGANFRHYLTWREKLFAGFLVINGALALGFTWVNDRYSNLTFLLPVGGMLLSVLFLSLDCRNRELFDACVAAGVELEQPATGVYTKLNANPQTATHSRTLEIAIWVWTFILGVATVLLFVRNLG